MAEVAAGAVVAVVEEEGAAMPSDCLLPSSLLLLLLEEELELELLLEEEEEEDDELELELELPRLLPLMVGLAPGGVTGKWVFGQSVGHCGGGVCRGDEGHVGDRIMPSGGWGWTKKGRAACARP